MSRGRVHWGRLRVWEEALAEVKRARSLHLKALLAVTAAVVLVNVFPRVPAYERGLITGALIVAYAWLVSWGTWVSTGLSTRLNGLWAEELTADMLDDTPGVHAVVPNLRYRDFDIDHVAICGAGVFAIETKWHGSLSHHTIARDANQAAKAARTLRLNLSRTEIPESLFRGALVIWGPAARELQIRELDTGFGSVTLIPGPRAATWLAQLAPGPVGPDYATELAQELTELAISRDNASPRSANRVTGWLARVR